MKFWDASALVPLLAEQSSSPAVRELAAADAAITTWWGTEIECVSALSRLERELGSQYAGFERLQKLAAHFIVMDPSHALKQTAARFLRLHPLRAGDALQLAAAFLAAKALPQSLDFVTLDQRLAAAARLEGFPVLVPGAPAVPQ